MAKFYGTVGYALSSESETSPGVWTDKVVEVRCTGDVVTNQRRWQQTTNVNPDDAISDTISIIADDFLASNQYAMRYVKWRGQTLSIVSVTLERPRAILAIGGLYSGPTADAGTDGGDS